MAVLFQNRKLADSFPLRNVVILSRGNRNRLGELWFELDFDFGQWGRWKNEVRIPVKGVPMWEVTKKLKNYQQDLLEQIDVLEDVQLWARGNMAYPYSKVLCQEKPMYFHAVCKDGTLNLKIFGEGLFDMAISWDVTRVDHTTGSFEEKIEEFRQAMADHLTQIEQIEFSNAVEGACA
jgi:hypothetical protein